MINKKYYTIGEVSTILNIPDHRLRYLEKNVKMLDIYKVRGRRYYTIEDINILKNSFNQNIFLKPLKIAPNLELLPKIEELINKFKNIAEILANNS